MDKTPGSRKLLLKPASFQSNQSEQNGNSSENGSAQIHTVNNPFLKCEKDEPEATKLHEENNEHEKDPAKQTTNNLFKPVNLFAASSALSALSENSNFVFGQNLHERVVMENVNSTPGEQSDDSIKKVEETHLFSTVITSSIKPKEQDKANDENLQGNGETPADPALKGDEENKVSTEAISSVGNLSLVEAARKYEEMRGAQKRKYEEVETTTGEEDERNILEINCKLFTFIENNYEERGRGMLRLNDVKASSHSRVVFRASGSLRVLLNTKVWRDQVCEQPSPKSLRLTAFDANGVIKIYLVMGRNEDMSHLFRALNSRILKARDRTPEPEAVKAQPEATNDHPDEEKDEPANKKSATSE